MWTFNGKKLDTIPEGYIGFIYKITDTKTGKSYIGKKVFNYSKKRKLTVKERVGTRKKVERIKIDSNWQNYWGSCRPLLEWIEENGTKTLKREIIKLCKDKQSLAYWEAHFLFKEEVLFSNKHWNSNILGRYFKNKIHD